MSVDIQRPRGDGRKKDGCIYSIGNCWAEKYLGKVSFSPNVSHWQSSLYTRSCTYLIG